MITTIVRNAAHDDLLMARMWTSDQLHIPRDMVSPEVAVAYIVKHFEQGAYSGWDGFVDMLDANAQSIARHKEN